MEKQDAVRGQINTVILSSLFDGEKYGYEIRKEIENKTSGKFILKEPTLYSSLKRLEKSGFVESSWGDIADTNGGRRRYYRLTEKGRSVCEKNLSEWEYSRTLMDKLISDKEIDLATAQAPAESGVASKVKRNYIREIDELSKSDDDEEEKASAEILKEEKSDQTNARLDQTEKDIAEAAGAIAQAREEFDSRIQQIESRRETVTKEPDQTELRAKRLAEFNQFANYSEPETSESAKSEPPAISFSEAPAPVYEIPYSAHSSAGQNNSNVSVRDLSAANHTYEPNAKISEQINRFAEENRERKAESDSKEFQNRLGKLLSSAKSYVSKEEFEKQDQQDEKVIDFESAASNRSRESRRTEPVENEDLKALSVKIQSEGFKIKAYSSDSSKDYKSFLLKNKINFFTALIAFAVFALEVFCFYVTTLPYTKQSFMLYGIFIGCAAIYPLVTFIAYKLNPDRKTKAKFSLRESAINCVLIFAIAFLVIMALNLIFKVQFANLAEIILKVFLPSLIVFQLVVGCLVYGGLYLTKKFHT